jgi:hypothetical protein
MTEELPSPRPPRWVSTALYVGGALLAAFVIFRAGSLWTLRAFAVAQLPPGHPNPYVAGFDKYALATLWPLPAAARLILAATWLRRGLRWRWVPLIVAVLWLAAYPLIKPPRTYYYFLTPVQPAQ